MGWGTAANLAGRNARPGSKIAHLYANHSAARRTVSNVLWCRSKVRSGIFSTVRGPLSAGKSKGWALSRIGPAHPLLQQAAFPQYILRGCILGMCDRNDFRQRRFLEGKFQQSRAGFGRVAFSPSRPLEKVAYFHIGVGQLVSRHQIPVRILFIYGQGQKECRSELFPR